MIDDIIAKYIEIRDRKAALKKEYEARTAPLDAAMAKIEAHLKDQMAKQGLESMPTKAGTAYTQRRTSATTADRNAFLSFIRSNDAWHLADIRPLKTSIDSYVEENGDLPPGINFRQELVVNVRRN